MEKQLKQHTSKQIAYRILVHDTIAKKQLNSAQVARHMV